MHRPNKNSKESASSFATVHILTRLKLMTTLAEGLKQAWQPIQAERAYESYIEDKKNDFKKRYIEHCRAGFDTEDFERSYQLNEYHYTLYYHDQSGIL
jgi:hypothetical protein